MNQFLLILCLRYWRVRGTEEAKARTDAAIAEFNREHRRRQQGGGGGVPVALIFWLIILAFVVLPMIFRRGGRHCSPPGMELKERRLPICVPGSGGRIRRCW